MLRHFPPNISKTSDAIKESFAKIKGHTYIPRNLTIAVWTKNPYFKRILLVLVVYGGLFKRVFILAGFAGFFYINHIFIIVECMFQPDVEFILKRYKTCFVRALRQ